MPQPYQDSSGQWYDGLGNPINQANPLANVDNPAPMAGFANGAQASQQAYLATGTAPTPHSVDYWKNHQATSDSEAYEKWVVGLDYEQQNPNAPAPYIVSDSEEKQAQHFAVQHNIIPNYDAQNSSAGEIGTTVSGAAAGAGIGGQIGGPVGAALGGFVGGVGGFAFGNSQQGPTTEDAFLGLAGDHPTVADQTQGYLGSGAAGQSLSTPVITGASAAQGGGGVSGGPSASLGGSSVAGSTGNPYLDALLQQTQSNVAQNQQFLGNTVSPQLTIGQNANWQANQDTQAAQNQLNQLTGQYTNLNGALAGQGYTAAGAAAQGNLGYQSQYEQTLNGMQQLNPTAYQGDWTSNAGDVANQQASLNQLQGIGGGSLSYNAAQAGMQNATLSQAQAYQAALSQAAYERSALSQAQSAGGSVEAEQAALSQLSGNAAGALNVQNGAASPEAYQAQLSALSQMGNLTNPARTAQEEFLYEQQRQKEVQDEATAQGAIMRKYRGQGMSGSGMELTAQLGAGQTNAQNRLLGDLGTQATAVQRATSNLQNYGALGSAMNTQGNQILQGNQAIRAGAAGAQGQLASDIRGQGDTLSMFNAGQSNQVGMFNANAFNNNQLQNAAFANQNSQFNANANNVNSMFNANAANQNSMFNANAYNQNQQFNAGQQNNASANNQQTQLSGSLGAASTANAMRSASDAVGLANKQQQGISNQANDIFRANQQVQATNRATDIINSGQNTTQTNLGNWQSAIGAAGTLNNSSLAAGQTDVAGQKQAALTSAQLHQQDVSNALSYGSLWTGSSQPLTASANDALKSAAGDYAANQAQGQLGYQNPSVPLYQKSTYDPNKPAGT